jgi:hypothetical protein
MAWGNYAGNFRIFGNPQTTVPGVPTTCCGTVYTTNVEGASRIPASFPDGTSNTIMFTERRANCGFTQPAGVNSAYLIWADGNGAVRPSFCDANDNANAPATCPLFQTFSTAAKSSSCNPLLANSLHFGCIPVCLADGSVRLVGENVSAATWGYACDPQDGNTLPGDWN